MRIRDLTSFILLVTAVTVILLILSSCAPAGYNDTPTVSEQTSRETRGPVTSEPDVFVDYTHNNVCYYTECSLVCMPMHD